MNRSFSLLWTLSCMSFVALAFIACSGEPTPPPNPPSASKPAPTAEPTAQPTSPPPAPTEVPDAGPPPPEQSSERPPVLKAHATEISDTFGISPGAKLELGTSDTDRVTLRIRENSLDRGYNITFKIDGKGKTTGVPVGKIYHTAAQVAGEPAFIKVTTSGKPFELTLPTGKKKNVNLAIGEMVTDDKGRQKINWTIIAPIRVDEEAGTAYFELDSLAEGYLHLTSKAPTAPPAQP